MTETRRQRAEDGRTACMGGCVPCALPSEMRGGQGTDTPYLVQTLRRVFHSRFPKAIQGY